MPINRSKLLAAVASLCATALPSAAESAADAPPVCDRLYVFGDSYSDSGFGYVDGNGPTAVVYAAHELGLTLLPADLGAASDSLNFAVSGANTGASEGRAMGRVRLGFGMQNQVDDFVAKVGTETATFDPANTIFFVAGGLNDRSLPLEKTASNIEGLIGKLHAVGARRFVLARIPLFFLPELAQRINPAIPGIAAKAQARYPGISIVVSDWGPYFDQVRTEAAQRGFTNFTDACAGRAIIRQDPTPCAAPRAYFFYHGDHPSTEAHRQVGALLAAEARQQWCTPSAATKRP